MSKKQKRNRNKAHHARAKSFSTNRIESTGRELNSRAGLATIAEYLDHHGILKMISKEFSDKKSSSKGAPVAFLVLQILAFFIDGTKLSLVWFDTLQRDTSHARVLGIPVEFLASSHSIKRFLRKFTMQSMRVFERIELTLFKWRLQVENPQELSISIDSVVYDNDDAIKREGVSPTYKKVKGFQPVNVLWNGYTVLTRFRRGSAHGNKGTFTPYAIRKVTAAIREVIPEAKIVYKFDSGFYSEKVFLECQRQQVECVMVGKMSNDVQEAALAVPEEEWKTLKKGDIEWRYATISFIPSSWKEAPGRGPISAVYTSLVRDDSPQGVLTFARPDQVVLTNVDLKEPSDELLCHSAKAVVKLSHSRGADELVHRASKEFGTEKFPCKRFFMNGAFYHFMIIAHNLLIAYQRDIVAHEEPELKNAMPTTVRRRVIDVAGHVTRTARLIIIKVAKEGEKASILERIWNRIHTETPAFVT